MQGRRTRRDGNRMRGADILGEFPLEFRNSRSLADPPASKRRQQGLLFLLAKGRPSDRDVSASGNGVHETSTALVAFTPFLHRISSRNPCSKETVARNPSSV